MTMQPSWRYQAWGELTRDDVYAILALRQRVFVVEHERACLDADGDDQRAWHLWRTDGEGTVLAYLRAFAPGTKHVEASLGRIVTAPHVRRTGAGRALVAEGLARLEARHGPIAVRIVAQSYLSRFYADFGFVPTNELVIDRIPHLEMVRASPSRFRRPSQAP
ncbi:MAG: GNAT family N-acetyltransferase [Polyangiales bacterium]